MNLRIVVELTVWMCINQVQQQQQAHFKSNFLDQNIYF